MSQIKRYDINEEWAHAGYVVAGDFVFLSYCVGDIGDKVEAQVRGALIHMEEKLAKFNLTLHDIVQVDVLLRDAWNIPIMEKVIKERFKGEYPERKTIQTNLAHAGGLEGLHVQIDGIAYCGKKS